MHLLFSTFLLALTFSLQANTSFTTQIHDIDLGNSPEDETLIFLSNGKVSKLTHTNNDTLMALETARDQSSWVNITLDKNRNIIALSSSDMIGTSEPFLNRNHFKSLGTFKPTVIESMTRAREIFDEARYNPKESQCYNRAHVWSYEWRVNHNILTSKIWLFFTRKYIRKYNFDWWFHVAPMLHVNIGGRMMERVADIKYARAPLRIKQWTDIFLRNDAECPLVENYSDGADYPESRWCYIMKSSMYYYQPVDLEANEKYGTDRSSWNEEEVRGSYLEAFDIQI